MTPPDIKGVPQRASQLSVGLSGLQGVSRDQILVGKRGCGEPESQRTAGELAGVL